MPLLLATNRLGTGVTKWYSDITETTSTTYYDTTWVGSAIWDTRSTVGSLWGGVQMPSAQADMWFHFDYRGTSTTISPSIGIQFVDTAGNFVEVYYTSALGYHVRQSISGVVTQIGILTSLASASVETFDFHITTGPTGYLEVFMNQVSKGAPAAATGAGIGPVVAVNLGRLSGATSTATSQIIAHTDDTREMKLRSRRPLANGFYTDGTGGVADVNNLPTNTTTSKVFSNPGEKATFTVPSAAAAGNMVIEGLAVNTMARNGGTAVAGADAMLRIGGTDYTETLPAADAVFRPLPAIWQVNPATGVRFTDSIVDGSQIGTETT